MANVTETLAAEAYYKEALGDLRECGVPFMVAGTYAVNAHIGGGRPTKDLDIFCKGSDFPKIVRYFAERGYTTSIEDERWMAKVAKGPYYFDLIFNSSIAVTPVTDEWFKNPYPATLFGQEILLLPPTELIWSKIFIQDRYKYDGSDVAHIMVRCHAQVDWRRLLNYTEQYWEVLLVHVLNFRFIYPTERECIPRWLLDELLGRLQTHIDLPVPQTRACRGRLFSRADYHIDVTKWGFADVVGGDDEHTPWTQDNTYGWQP